MFIHKKEMENMIKVNEILLWLDSFDFLTYRKKEKFLELFEDIQQIFNINNLKDKKESLLKIITDDEYNILKNQLTEKCVIDLLKNLEDKGINYITYYSKEYPNTLKNIDTPPFVIYYKGDISLLNTDCFSIVGSRQITSYGKMATEKFTKDLVKADFTIVSGLASGVDTVAHTITLAEKGKTIAVLAGGLEEIYPATNTNLAEQIIKNKGLIITETRCGKKTDAYMFPIRNRIIAGLSKGILITEAKEKSGVIHTKNYALEYGKDVFAIPGSIFSLTSIGTNRMIVNGQAKAVITTDDILEEYGISLQKKAKAVYNYSLEESIIINLLSSGEKTFQELAEQSKLAVKTLNSLLTTLSIRGIIKKLTGNIYYLID